MRTACLHSFPKSLKLFSVVFYPDFNYPIVFPMQASRQARTIVDSIARVMSLFAVVNMHMRTLVLICLHSYTKPQQTFD